MKDVIRERAAEWLAAGEPVAVATIVRVRGSSSQPLAARMVMTRGNRFEGAVSGGCVETDVYGTSQAVLVGGGPLMLHYKKVDDPLLEIGLSCNGMIDVLLEPLTPDLLDLLSGQGYVVVTVCDPRVPDAPDALHACIAADEDVALDVLSPEDTGALRTAARAALRDDRPATLALPDGRIALVEPLLPPPLLWIAGAEAVAAPLAQFARIMGYRVVISDARAAFAGAERFPAADAVIKGWPGEVIGQLALDERTCVVSLNHEPRFEDALLQALLGQPQSVRYIGAIGKPSRAVERIERAAAAGIDLERLPPIHTPVGLNIGGKSPQEIALSIIAEITAVRNGRAIGVPQYEK